MYVDCLPVELRRPLTVVSLAAKPQRTLKAYNRMNYCSKRIVSHAISAKKGTIAAAYALYQCASLYISGLYAVGVLITSLMAAAVHSLQ